MPKEKTNTKNSTKKNTKEKQKKEPKKVIKKETTKERIKKIITSTKFLSIVFVILLILVVVLSFLAYNMRKENPDLKIKPKIIIPLIQENDQLGFSINAIELSQASEYVFKITNYKKDKIIAVNIPYKLEIENGTDSVIEVFENDSNKDLMQNKRSLVLDNQVMPGKEEKNIYYHIRMKKKGELKDLDTINVVINTGKSED